MPLVAKEAIRGLRITDTPLRIFSTVILFGKDPGLINSIRLSNKIGAADGCAKIVYRRLTILVVD